MHRDIFTTLKSWKKETPHKPLIIRGARQIGKSYIVNQFGHKEYETYIVLNFERNPEFKEIFSSFNPIDIIEKISLYSGKKIHKTKTLIFLDEIQECPQAIMALRYFYEEMPEIHIIAAGSLLEFSLQSEHYRMPVGRVQYLYMYPMRFGEFLIALDQNLLYEYISDVDRLTKLPEGIHEKLLEYTRKYFMIGGMPEVVNSYIKNREILECQKIQHSIIETYRDDFSKYARKSEYKYIRKVFSAIPGMIGQKVVYSHIDPSIKSRDLKNAIDLLTMAGIIYKVKRTSAAGLPLEAGAKENYYKPMFLDIGLMHAMNGIYSETVRKKDLTAIFNGAVAEQFVGQELLALSNCFIKSKLYYWGRESKNSNAEVDFLTIMNEKIIPIEVKSGKKGTLKSLLSFLSAYEANQGIKISQTEYKNETDLLSLPLYAMESLFKKS